MTYNEFKNKYLGQVLDVDHENGAQCWDLVQKYIIECLGLPASIISGLPTGIVSDLLREPKLSLMKQYFDVIPLDKKLPGDIEVWDYGHIAIMDHWDGQVNHYLTQNSGTAEKPIGGVYLGAIQDNPNCMAFRKKNTANDEINKLKAQITDLTNKNNDLQNRINNAKKALG